MDALVDLIATIPQRPIGTIVHVGAGSFAAGHYEHVEARRIVLVEGDPDTAAALKRSAVGETRRFEIVADAVAPAAGPIRWHRYNVRMLNGPTDRSGLEAVYPRLRCIEVLSLRAVSFQELLERPSLVPDGPHGRPMVLALDVPEQEAALLASASPDALRRFDWVAVRCRAPAAGGGVAPRPDKAVLQAAGFAEVGRGVADDPVWPVCLYKFDRARYARQKAERELASARQQLGQLEKEFQALQGKLAESEAARVAIQQQLAERNAQHQQATKDAQQLRSELTALRTKTDELQKKLTEAEAARSAMQAQQAERDARQRLLDSEILKAEAQLELIKDVLLREKNF